MLKERPFTFPLGKQIHMICDTDVHNEADNQYCTAHTLMIPRFDMGALVTARCGMARDACPGQRNYEEVHWVVGPMGLGGEVTILHGAPSCMKEPNVLIENGGTRLIVEKAMKEDSRSLFVCCIGAVTNLVCAYLMNPEIVEKLTVIWIGGDAYPEGGSEYNLHNGVLVANVMSQSGLKLWQASKPVYITVKVSFFEFLSHVYPCGDIGRYLVENTMRVAEYEAEVIKDTSTPLGSRYLTMSCMAAATSSARELWSLGDSPVVGLMLNHTIDHFHMIDMLCGIRDDYTYSFPKPGNRKICVHDNIGSHPIIEDFFERMELYSGGSGRQRVAE